MMADRFVFFPGFFLITGLLLVIGNIGKRLIQDKPALIAEALLLVVSPFAYFKTVARLGDIDSARWTCKDALRLDSTNTEAQGYLRLN